uniref:Integrase catalytic domain-containing protein n=1 Tax=Glossina morsitans morsitans TaxID=37546 RepID=A0A1B0F9G5_GLOMM
MIILIHATKHIYVEPVVCSPQQSRVERLNTAIAEKSKAMIIESKLPKNMWSKGVLASAYTINRCLSTSNEGDKNPI